MVAPAIASEITIENGNVEVPIVEAVGDIELPVEEVGEVELSIGEIDSQEPMMAMANEIVADPPEIVEYDYKITLSNFPQYNIIALNDANLNQETEGSIWVGGMLSGSPQAHGDNYIYNIESSVLPEGFFYLTADVVSKTRDYWYDLMEEWANGDEHFVYAQPNSQGIALLNLGNFGQEADHIYWTDATEVYANNVAGHIIAPYATVYLSGNICGSVLGWNIEATGKSYINSFAVEKPEPKATPAPGKIYVKKTLVNDVWHIRCDVMDGTTFEAGGGYWKTDVIMNPESLTSHEGHRSNKCGDANHWIIWLDNNGTPFRMDEIKSGATGGTLPTMIFQEVYSPQDLGLNSWNELEPTDTERIEKYKENFKIEKDITTVVPGERIYWVTWDDSRRWYHTGVPYVAPPTFIFYIDGEPYPIVAGETLELEDVLPGAHEIKEDSEGYIITIYGGQVIDDTTTMVELVDGETIEVEFVNEVITPPTVSPSPPPTIKPSPSPTPTPTPRPTVPGTKPTPPPLIPQTGEGSILGYVIVFSLALLGVIALAFAATRKKNGSE